MGKRHSFSGMCASIYKMFCVLKAQSYLEKVARLFKGLQDGRVTLIKHCLALETATSLFCEDSRIIHWGKGGKPILLANLSLTKEIGPAVSCQCMLLDLHRLEGHRALRFS